VCSQCNPIALNEYNAVGAMQWLGGGNQAADASGAVSTDTFFGRVMSNGGNWFELVIVADHVDMRGWKLDWTENGASGRIQLSTNAFWSDMRAGMIVTIIQRTTAEGGLDTDLSYSPGTGDRWVNVNSFDTALVSGTTSTKPGHVSGEFTTSNDQWTLTIRNAQGAYVAGPFGEGSPYYHGPGVSNQNVCRLRADITGRVNAASYYDDSKNSTFGAPNTWAACPGTGTITQSFAALPIAGCTYTVPNPADLDGDGTTSGSDLGLLLSAWTV
jgi:hypothetical protein